MRAGPVKLFKTKLEKILILLVCTVMLIAPTVKMVLIFSTVC